MGFGVILVYIVYLVIYDSENTRVFSVMYDSGYTKVYSVIYDSGSVLE